MRGSPYQHACMITHAHACAHKQKAAMGHQGAQPAAPRRHALPRPREGPRCPGEGTVHGTTAQKPSVIGIPSHKPRPNTQGMRGTQHQPQGTHDVSVELPWRAMIAGLRERRPGHSGRDTNVKQGGTPAPQVRRASQARGSPDRTPSCRRACRATTRGSADIY